jgi:hypothetical protein
MATGVDERDARPELGADSCWYARARIASSSFHGSGVPGSPGMSSCSIDPGLFAIAKAPDTRLETIALRVNGADEHGNAGGHLGRVGKAAIGERAGFDLRAIVLPRLAEHGVDELAQPNRVVLDAEEFLDELRHLAHGETSAFVQ